jgi:hypothetical protein
MPEASAALGTMPTSSFMSNLLNCVACCCLQVGGDVAFVQDGQVLQRLSSSCEQTAATEGGLLPVLLSVEPPCLCGSGKGPCFSLLGHNLQWDDVEVLCRSAGRHLYPDVVRGTAAPGVAYCHGGHAQSDASRGCAGELKLACPAALEQAGLERMHCQLPPLQGCHLLLVEVCKQGYLSAALPLLAVEDAELAAELRRCLSSMPPRQQEALLRDFAAILQHQENCQHCQCQQHERHCQPCAAAAGSRVQAAACRVAAFASASVSPQLVACALPLLLAHTDEGCTTAAAGSPATMARRT